MDDRILFLDFDGVLHPFGCGASARFGQVGLLHRILEQNPRLKVVVHSSWREIHDDAALKDFLFKSRPLLADRFLGATPREVMSRWESIEAWVELHKPKSVCILDDEARLFPNYVVAGQDPVFNFVLCPTKEGLREHSSAWSNLRRWIYRLNHEKEGAMTTDS